MSSMTAIQPAPLDISMLPHLKLGELLVETNSGILYMVILDENSEKVVVPVKGEGYVKMMQYLKYNNLIQDNPPTKDHALNWFRTDLSVVFPSGREMSKSAYIMVKAEDESADSGYVWKQILPITLASNIILSSSNDHLINGRPYTLLDLINVPSDPKKAPTVKYRPYVKDKDEKPKRGQLALVNNGSNRYDLRLGVNDEYEVVASNLDENSRVMLENSIRIGNNMPLNFNENTIWATYNPDTPIDYTLQDARTLMLHTVDVNLYKNTGLRFIRLNNTSNAEGIHILENGKAVSFNPSQLLKTAAVKTNISYPTGENEPRSAGFKPEAVTYFEVSVERDYLGQMSFMLSSEMEVAEEVKNTENSLIFAPQGYKLTTESNYTPYKRMVDNVEQDVHDYFSHGGDGSARFSFEMFTVFFEITRNGESTITPDSVRFGYIDANREKVYVTGENGIELRKIKAFYLLNGNGGTIDTLTKAYINQLKIKELEDGIIPVNNLLYGENVFKPASVLTNAKSVHISGQTTLSDLIDGGRLITTLRTYNGRTLNAGKPGELLVEYEDNGGVQLRIVDQNGNAKPIINEYEELIKDHLANSAKYLARFNNEGGIAGLPVDEDDLSKVYYIDNANLDNNQLFSENGHVLATNFIQANPAITVDTIDSVTGATNKEYKYVLSSTLSNLVRHVDFERKIPIDGVKQKWSGSVEQYLEEVQSDLNNIFSNRDVVYSLTDTSARRSYRNNRPLAEEDLNDIESSQEYTLGYILDIFNRTLKPGRTLVRDIVPASTPGVDIYSRLLKGLERNGKLRFTKIDDNTIHLSIKSTFGDNEGKEYVAYVTGSNNGSAVVFPNRVNWKLLTTKNIYKNSETDIIERYEDTSDRVIVNDTLTVKNKGIIKHIATKDIVIEANSNNVDSKGISIKDPNWSINNINLIKHSGRQNDSITPNILIGDKDVVDIVKIASKSQPSWIDEDGDSHNILIDNDLTGLFAYKGKLNEGSQTPRDLNEYNQVSNIGYYTYRHIHTTDNELERLSFPADSMPSGVMILEVFLDKTVSNSSVIMQRLHHYEMDEEEEVYRHHTYTRSGKTTGGFGPWIKMVDKGDLDTKLDKTGGTITGSLNITEDLTVDGAIEADSVNANSYNIDDKPVISKATDDEEDITYHVIGNEDTNAVINYGNIKYKNSEVANVGNVNALETRVASTYATKEQLKGLSNATISKSTFDTFIDNVLTKTDINQRMSGSILVGASASSSSDHISLSTSNGVGTITMGENTKFNLPGAESFELVETNNVKPGIAYNMGGEGARVTFTGSDSLVNFTQETPTTVGLTAIKLEDENRSMYYLDSIYGKNQVSDSGKIITSLDVFTLADISDNSERYQKILNDNKGGENIYGSGKYVADLEAVDYLYRIANGKDLGEGSSLTRNDISTGVRLTVGSPLRNLRGFTDRELSERNVSNPHAIDVIEANKRRRFEKDMVDIDIIQYPEDGNINGKWDKVRLYKGVKIKNDVANGDPVIKVKELITSDNGYYKSEIDTQIGRLSNKLDAFTKSMNYTSNAEGSVGINKMIHTVYISPNDNNNVGTKTLLFTLNMLPLNLINGMLILSIKGADGSGRTLDMQLNISLTRPRASDNGYLNMSSIGVSNHIPGSTWDIFDATLRDNVISFKVDDRTAGSSNVNTGFNLFAQLFGEVEGGTKKVSEMDISTSSLAYIDRN